MNIDQPKVARATAWTLREALFSQERLIGFLTKLGMDVEIVVRPSRENGKPPAQSCSYVRLNDRTGSRTERAYKGARRRIPSRTSQLA